MTAPPLLRIVIPVLNEAARLPALLAALQPLRQRGAEVVAVDGGSTDASWMLLRHATPHLLDALVVAPRSRAAQMNAGASAQTGSMPSPDIKSLLWFLHVDSQFPAHADALIRAALATHVWGRFDVRIHGQSRGLRVVAALMNARSRLTGIATGDQGLFMRRSAFDAVGGFAAQPLMEDIAISTALRRLGPPACLRERLITSGRRWDTQGLWRTIALMWCLRAAYALGADPVQLAQRYGYRTTPTAPATHVAIMAKAPIAGLAKTRLIPRLGATGAARAQRRFIHHTLAAARGLSELMGAEHTAATLWCTPDATHPSFAALQALHPRLRCAPQPAGDLGARMAQAVNTHFAQHPDRAVLLIGTDCPLLSPGHLHTAAVALRDHDAVLIPAEDGGYVLLGLRQPCPAVFEGIAWSTPEVLVQTLERLHAAGQRCAVLEPLWDVDTPADWERLCAARSAVAGRADHTSNLTP